MPQPYLILPTQGSDPADEWLRLGVNAHASGDLPKAQENYNHALRLDPRHAVALQNLAIVFAQSPGLINDALLTIERAIMCDSTLHVLHMNRALIALEAGRVDEAIAAIELAVQLSPDDGPALWAQAIVLTTAGMPEKSVPIYRKILEKEPKHPAAGPNACFIQTLTDAGPKELLAQRKCWREANGHLGPLLPHYNDRSESRSLRVGYVGGDFKQHSAAFIFSRILLHHTPAVEMYLYSSLPVDPNLDGRTKKFKDAAGERWRDISTMPDEEAARLIRNDKIDILVDLAGHTNGGRLGLFTHKPAPVQVTAWGFAHGTGLPEIDYFFADPIAVPQEEREHFAEKIFDLPCIVTMEEPAEYALKDASQAPFKRNGYITFGSYARYEKMSEACIKTFAEILRRIPDSKLQLKDHAYRRPYSIRRVMSLMPDIAPERLLFSTATDHRDHMLSYQQCDIALDPYPHGGGVVCLEQLWMGVPVVTKYGTQPAGRSAASVLTCMGRHHWIAKTDEEYVNIAVAMTDDSKQLADVRKTLRKALLDSPVVKGYVEAVEAAYRAIWKTWCEK